MSLYLGIAIVLFVSLTLFLFFTVKEGFYSDMNITSTTDALKMFNQKLETLKTTMSGLSNSDLSIADAISSISKILATKEKELYNSGVVGHVQIIKNEIDVYQNNVLLLNEALQTIPKTFMVTQYDTDGKTKISVSLIKTVENLMEQANKLSSKLNKIPDS